MRRGVRTDYKTRSTCLDAAALPGRAGSAMRFQPAFGIERKGWSFGPEGGGNSQGIIRAGRPADELSRAARGTEKEGGRSFCAGQVRLMVWTQQRAAAAQEVQASGGDHSTRDDGTTGWLLVADRWGPPVAPLKPRGRWGSHRFGDTSASVSLGRWDDR